MDGQVIRLSSPLVSQVGERDMPVHVSIASRGTDLVVRRELLDPRGVEEPARYEDSPAMAVQRGARSPGQLSDRSPGQSRCR